MKLQAKLPKLAQFCLGYFSHFGSFAVTFEWVNGDCFLEKLEGFPLLVWNAKEFWLFSLLALMGFNLQQKWDYYIEHQEITQLMIDTFFLLSMPFCCTLQLMFHRHKEELINLVNQTIKLANHFEKGEEWSFSPTYIYLL